MFQFNMSDLETNIDVSSIKWPKRVDPSDTAKLLLFQFIEAWDLVDVCFHSYNGTDARMKNLSAWKKVWMHALR